MRSLILAACLFTAPGLIAVASAAAPAVESTGWQSKVSHDLPLMGHRNWVLIVDAAYPLQSSSGVETFQTNADGMDVLKYVLNAIQGSSHVRPDIFMDAELPYVQEEDAPGTSAYRDAIAKLFDGVNVTSEAHEQLIHDIDDSSKLVHVLVLKTRMAIPYSSVFIRLNCKYWGDDAEERLRAKMGTSEPAQPATPPAEVPAQNQQQPAQPAQPQPAQPTSDQNAPSAQQSSPQPSPQSGPQ
jgi:L-fucose mutarotase/ribose pyranase (RbsD/FucU family)